MIQRNARQKKHVVKQMVWLKPGMDIKHILTNQFYETKSCRKRRNLWRYTVAVATPWMSRLEGGWFPVCFLCICLFLSGKDFASLVTLKSTRTTSKKGVDQHQQMMPKKRTGGRNRGFQQGSWKISGQNFLYTVIYFLIRSIWQITTSHPQRFGH